MPAYATLRDELMAFDAYDLEADFAMPDGSVLTGYSVHFPAPFHPTAMRESAYEHLNALRNALPKGTPRLMPIGRLDLNTEGLLLLTNDGSLARAMELPKTGFIRHYRARAHGKITQTELDTLKGGITLDDGTRYTSIEAELERETGTNNWINVRLSEGKNREVRKALEHLNLQVNRLIRTQYGPFELGDLRPGAVEEIPSDVLRSELIEFVDAKLLPEPPELRPARRKPSGGARVHRRKR